jgi:Alpha amylase, catalytic domain
VEVIVMSGSSATSHPLLYQINTRVWLRALSQQLGQSVTLDDIPDRELDLLAEQRFDWVWFLSVWQTGEASRAVSRSRADWRSEFEETLPDLRQEDIAGSGFAVSGYRVAEELGGDAALIRLRRRLAERGLRLLLDFVPNHIGLDHPWVHHQPQYIVCGSDDDVIRAPENYCRIQMPGSEKVFAHGRDPYFPGWPDTLQLNYGDPSLQNAMIDELRRIAALCDGVRCDMAMLILPDIFERTWGIRAEAFWPRAIETVRREYPTFIFMAEVYWDLEWTMQQQGFDYTYDKRLYDRLREGHARPVRDHLRAGMDFQNRSVRFLENHDEPRAAFVFQTEMHEAAAVITYLAAGLRFFHQGQFEGRRRRISPHLSRGPDEPVNSRLSAFYQRVLNVLRVPAVRRGQWQLLECLPAWEGNWTSDCFVASAWDDTDRQRLLTTVNYAANQSQCYLRLPWSDLHAHQWRLRDLLGSAVYDRDGQALESTGLYLDMPPWGYHVFSLDRLG